MIVAIILCIFLWGCAEGTQDSLPSAETPFRQQMREFVQSISAEAKGQHPGFLVIPQNGHELLTLDGEPSGPRAEHYLRAIDGVGREDLFYGYDEDDVPTPAAERDRMIAFMDLAQSAGIRALVTDYCSTPAHMDDAYQQNAARGYLSLAADHRELDDIPGVPASPFHAHPGNVTSLAEARNFLYLLSPEIYPTRNAYINALRSTDYDLLILDLFYQDQALTQDELASLKTKAHGGSRLLIAYMSIGEAEEYRYYWQPEWSHDPPAWLAEENPNWPGNYKVDYWDPDWQRVIDGGPDAYLQHILDAGFDGVYLDIIDAYEYFEE